MEFKCEICDNLFEARRYDYENRRKVTCSDDCLQKLRKLKGLKNKTGKEYVCDLPSCGKIIYRRVWQIKQKDQKSGYFFCSKPHQVKARYELSDFKSGKQTAYRLEYRNFALHHYGKKCSNCEQSEEALLDVHHIDGNRKNNNAENLIVLCVLCHAKVTRGCAIIQERTLVEV